MTKLFARLAGVAAVLTALTGMPVLAQTPEQYTTFEKYGFCGSIDDSCYNSWYDRTSGEEEPWKVFIFSHVATGVNPHDNRDAGVEALTVVVVITFNGQPGSGKGGVLGGDSVIGIVIVAIVVAVVVVVVVVVVVAVAVSAVSRSLSKQG